MKLNSIWFLAVAWLLASNSAAFANDPCGMVPPIYTGIGSPITRIGLQQTYVFYKGGVETFVIKPGFSGKVDNFGMLIPFPTPPEIRKVPDNIFSQIANAVDPPEVVVDLTIRPMPRRGSNLRSLSSRSTMSYTVKPPADQVHVLKQEAVGMYEVAVLAAGSSQSLKKWMDENGYQFPKGMDSVCDDYIADNWCFVAVKTKVAQQTASDPQPGQREIDNNLPSGSTFDGFVQGMGFRFTTDELVVPMRLSAFNEGELRNVVYILTDEPKKIRSIPEEFVQRQISGKSLIVNLNNPLPLRVIGGDVEDIPRWQRETLARRRDPEPYNGVAKQLFAADLAAVASGNLSLEHEEKEKELLAIGEHFGLRGPAIDEVNAKSLSQLAREQTESALKELQKMTLTVVDGDFPRNIIANQNLTFVEYSMPAGRNTNRNYDPKTNSPGEDRVGKLILGAIELPLNRQVAESTGTQPVSCQRSDQTSALAR